MNFKFVRQKVMVGAIASTLCIASQSLISEATEIEAAPENVESEEVELYGEISFGDIEGYTYIYSEASDEGDWIGKLYDDNMVTILSIDETWAEIESGSVHGYVATEYLLMEEEANIRATELAITWAVVDTAWLNVRTGPSTDYEIIDTVASGTKLLEVGESVDNWQLVQLGETICYVSGNYIIEETEYSYAESKEEEAQRLADYENALTSANQETSSESSDVTEVVEEVISTSVNVDSSYEYTGLSGQSVVDYAMQFIGNPYVWGGTDLVNGADCSGFVQSVYAYFGISLPRTSSEQRSAGVEVSYSEIQVGDIVCYEGHVGIYIGNDQIVNAIGSNYGIGISSATYSNIITIRRVI